MREDEVYLSHIRDAIAQIQMYTTDGRESFFRNTMIQDAVVRNLEIIGEAVKHVSAELRDRNPEIPWQRVAGMRDVLIHNYLGVDLKLVWDVVQNRLPDLLRQIEQILGENR